MALIETEDISNLLPNVHSGWTVYGGAVAVDDRVVELNGGRARAIMTVDESSYKSNASCLTIYLRYWNTTNPNTHVKVHYNSKSYLFICSKLGAEGELLFFEVPMEPIAGSNQFPSMDIAVESEGGSGRVYLEVAFRRNLAAEVEVATEDKVGIVRPNTSWGMKVATEADEDAGVLVGDIGPNLSDQFEIDASGQIRIKDGAVGGGGGGAQITSIQIYSDGFSYNNTVGFQTLANGDIKDLTTGTTITYTGFTDSILNHLGATDPPAETGTIPGTYYLDLYATLTVVKAADTLQTFYTAIGRGTFVVNWYDIVDSSTGEPDWNNGGAMYVRIDDGYEQELEEGNVYRFNTKLEVIGTYSSTTHSEYGTPMAFYFDGVVTVLA